MNSEGLVIVDDIELNSTNDDVLQTSVVSSEQVLREENLALKAQVQALQEVIAELQYQVNVCKRRKAPVIQAEPVVEARSLEERVTQLESKIQTLMGAECVPIIPATKETTTKKKRKLKQASSETDGEKISVAVWGDSMIRKVKLKGHNSKLQAVKHCHPGASLNSMSQLLSSPQTDECEPKTVLIHVGTNTLKRTASGGVANHQSFVADFVTLLRAARHRYKEKRIVISGIIFRRGFSDYEINRVNEAMENEVKKHKNIQFVDSNCWLGEQSLAGDGLHLNTEGAKKLEALFTRILMYKPNE